MRQKLLILAFSLALTGCLDFGVLTPSEVVEKPEKKIGQTITVKGVAGVLWSACTEVACPTDNPCCNACTGSLALYTDDSAFSKDPTQGPFVYQADVAAIGLEFPERGGCNGNGCEIAECKPLQLGQQYTITGLLVECYAHTPWCLLRVEAYQQK